MRVIDALRVDLPDTLLRLFPHRVHTGLLAVGRPDRDAPLLLTGNFRLTVERVERALSGQDVWLLVADSKGINVWCAATGGHFTTHDVVNALKASGVGARLNHRRVILPQLAATGIDGATVRERTGWRVIWGPVRAADLPEFLSVGRKASKAMREVTFPWAERLEMAVAWAFPVSVLAALVALLVWPQAWLGLVALVWAMALVLFLAFPLYAGHLGTGVPSHLERAAPVGAAAAFVVLRLVAELATRGAIDGGAAIKWGAASLAIALIVGLDLSGSTPLLKSGLHGDRRMAIELDPDLCTGAGFCETVCPVRVFEVDHHRKLATMPRAHDCVQCGACIVQCPFDALHFRLGNGDMVTPETVRAYKLNLLGKRAVVGDVK